MPQYKVELNRAGVAELLKSKEMQAILRAHAQKIAGSDGYIDVYVAGTRAVAEASGNNKDNAMLKRMR